MNRINVHKKKKSYHKVNWTIGTMVNFRELVKFSTYLYFYYL